MERVRLGVVGAGPWGHNLVRNVADCPRAQLAVVCDVDEHALQRVRDRYPNVRTVDRIDAVLDTPALSGVLIATPPQLHYRHARTALSAGLHVLVEKPLCTTSADAADLCRLAAQQQRTLMVGHTYHYNNLAHEVKRRIDGGELGDIRYAYARRLNLGRVRSDVDALWNLAPHDISLLCYLLDGWPVRASARGWCFVQPERDIADVCFFHMDFADGRAAAGHVSWLDPQKVRTVVVVGSERMLVYDDLDPSRHIQVYDKGVEPQQSPLEQFADHARRVRSGELRIPNVRLVQPLGVEIDHFVDCILTGDRPRSDGLQGLRMVMVLEAMTRSIRQGGANQPVNYTTVAALAHGPTARTTGRDTQDDPQHRFQETATWIESHSMTSELRT